MNQTTLNTIKVFIAFLALVIFYILIINIIKPLFTKVSPLYYTAVLILLFLAIFILVPFLIFQFRGKE